MKSIEIPAVHISQLTLPAIAQELKSQGRPTCIDVVNWAKYGYKPMVNLYLGHSSSRLWCLFNELKLSGVETGKHSISIIHQFVNLFLL